MIILGTNSIKDTGYDVANSCRFNKEDTAYMHKTTSAGNRRTWSFSTWLKRISLGTQVTFGVVQTSTGNDNIMAMQFTSANKLEVWDYAGGITAQITTNRLFRDTSAWMHILISADTTSGTANNRLRLYINGTEERGVGGYATDTMPSQNYDFDINQDSKVLKFGAYDGGSVGSPADFYFAETVFVDGTALSPTDVGEFDSDSPTIWKPKDVSGLTFGTNGFYLDYEDSSNLGNDANGGTDLTEVNLTAIDQSTDTCTNNFATMNPLAVPPSNAPTFAEGNTKVSTNNANGNPVLSTIGVSQGKWYVECKRISYDGGSGADDGFRIGFGVTYDQNVNIIPAGISNSGHYFMIGNGIVYNGSTDLGDKAGDSNVSDNGVVGIALDLDNNRISWSFDGVWMTGSGAWSGSSPSSYVTIESGKTYFFLQNDGSTGRAYTAGWNFGGTSAFAISSGNTDANGYGNFETAPPSGYYALNTKNLAEFG